jgi:hypothetical protein
MVHSKTLRVDVIKKQLMHEDNYRQKNQSKTLKFVIQDRLMEIEVFE